MIDKIKYLMPVLNAHVAAVQKITIAVSAALLLIAFILKWKNVSSAKDQIHVLLYIFILVGLVCNSDTVIHFIEDLMNCLIRIINPNYLDNPLYVAQKISNAAEQTKETSFGMKILLLGPFGSLYKALMSVVLWVCSQFAYGIAFVLEVIQMGLVTIARMFMPIAIASLALPMFSSAGVGFLMRVLAILMWPLGFALVSLLIRLLILDSGDTCISGLNTGNIMEFLEGGVASLVGIIFGLLFTVFGNGGVPVFLEMMCHGGGGLGQLAQKMASVGSPGKMMNMAAGLASGGLTGGGAKGSAGGGTSGNGKGGGSTGVATGGGDSGGSGVASQFRADKSTNYAQRAAAMAKGDSLGK